MMHSVHRFGLVGLVVIGAMLGGCANKEKAAREEFSEKRSCPIDRVTSKPRTDLSAYDLTFGNMKTKGPPANVANDPARIAMWEKEQDDRRASWDSSSWVYEVTGCNETGIYICSIAGRGSTHSGQAMCSVSK